MSGKFIYKNELKSTFLEFVKTYQKILYEKVKLN